MIALLPLLADPVDLALQVEEPIEAENAALRHQLIVLQRRMRGRVQFTNRDRLFLGRCVSSSATRPVSHPTSSRASWLSRCRSGSANNSSLRTDRAPARTSRARRSCLRPPDGSMLLQVTSTNAVNETTRRRRKDRARRDARLVQ